MKRKSETSVSIFKRARIVLIFFFLLFSILVVRLVHLQVFNSSYYFEKAQNQSARLVKIMPERGDIFDRNGKLLTFNIKLKSIYANPNEIEDVWNAAERLQPVLKLQLEEIAMNLDKQKCFVWIQRKVDKETAERIKGLNIQGINFLNENKRIYLSSELYANIIGFAGDDNAGLEGLEKYYDKELSGEEGKINLCYDGIRRCSKIFQTPIEPIRNGRNLYLTLDTSIQYFTYKTIKKYVKRFHAQRGMAIVMDPKTGEILAMVNYPTFDSNEFFKTPKKYWKNSCIIDSYEPGSTFKIITAAALIESNSVDFKKKIYCEDGEYTVLGRTIKDVKKLKYLTFRDIIVKSSNIGMVKVSRNLDRKFFSKIMMKFGFGYKTEIDYPGEIKGLVRPYKEWSKSSLLAIPIGYEISVTPLQIVTAYCAIANDGVLMKPFLISRIEDKDNNEIETFNPQRIRQVISKKTTDTLKTFMELVIEEGTGKAARIPGVKICGKTGTSSKFNNELNQYSKEKYLSSFIGFFPKEEPKYVIGVFIDEPQKYIYGSVVAAPPFKEIAEYLVNYENINYKRIYPNNKEIPTIENNKEITSLEAGYMPDLNKLPVRDVVKILSKYNIDFELEGTGFVVEQFPEPGEPFENIKPKIICKEEVEYENK